MNLDLEQFDSLSRQVLHLRGVHEVDAFEQMVVAAQGSQKTINSTREQLKKRSEMKDNSGKKSGQTAPLTDLDAWMAGHGGGV